MKTSKKAENISTKSRRDLFEWVKRLKEEVGEVQVVSKKAENISTKSRRDLFEWVKRLICFRPCLLNGVEHRFRHRCGKLFSAIFRDRA